MYGKFKRALAFVLSFAILMTTSAFAQDTSATDTGDVIIAETDKALRLWYDEEAPYVNDDAASNPGSNTSDGWERWSLPLGNGHFGANVFGRTDTERIQLSEKTLANPYYTAVSGYGSPSLGGLNNFSETYIDFAHPHEDVTNYVRDLDLKTAISSVKYDYENVTYSREYFVSFPDKVMVIKLDASEEGALTFTLRPTIPYEQDYAVAEGDGASKHGTVVASEGGNILLSGLMGYYGIEFEGQYKVIPTGGEMTFENGVNEDGETDNGTITVTDADSAYIVLSIGTNYELNSTIFTESDRLKKLSASTTTAHDKVSGYMSSALSYNYEQLKQRHIDDYYGIFGRVSVDLGAPVPEITTDELLANYKSGTYNTYLEELYFQYGRYLLIASSREGSLPANLQGVWNRYNFSPWSSGFWHNINVQMNYWPAFNTNMAETFIPYIDYNNAYMPKAEEFATSNVSKYNSAMLDVDGGNGWCIGTGASPLYIASSRSAGNVGFTTKLYWDYYDFTRDTTILEETVYPVISSGARYITKIVEEDENGNYITSHSDSPEQYVNEAWYYTKGSTYDQSFAYENNADTKKAAEILGIDPADDTILNTIDTQLDLYDPIQIGYSGQVKEFREEDYYGDLGEYTHRHISQLVGLYPGSIINETTPAWLDGAIVTLTERGDKATGWGMAHRLNLWARTKRGNRTYQVLQALLKSGTATNLWDLHPPFQIDGNLGGSAGIAEMLLQSHEGYIAPLAAVPDAWATGSYTGLVARGNFEVSAAWENGSAKTFNILSNVGGECRVGYFDIKNAKVKTSDGEEVTFTAEDDDLISFDTTAGETYIIYNLSEKETIAPATNVSAVSETKNDFNITWTESSDAVSYNVYKAVENDADYTLLGNTTDTSYAYTTSSDEENKRMTYRVCAVSASGRESDSALAYVNPVEMNITDTEAIQLASNVFQIAVKAEGDITSYKLYTKTADGEYTLAEESEYPVFILDSYDETVTYGVSVVSGYFESEITAIDEVIIASTEEEEDSQPQEYDNLLLGKTFTKESGATAMTDYGTDKLTDGSFALRTGRFAVTDAANSNVVLLSDLGGTYELGEMKIYDHVGGDETHTRSDQTTIEIFYNNTWTTVVDKQPLDYDGTQRVGDKYTTFDLTGNIASKIRLTFANTSGEAKGISIYEIEMAAKDYVSTYSDNLLLGKEFTGTSTTGVNKDSVVSDGTTRHYGFDCLTDGNFTVHYGRFAAGDAANCTVVAECALGGVYTLDDLRIYDHAGSSEGRSRSDQTTVEVYYDGEWTTLIDKQPLTFHTGGNSGGKGTTWDLGGVKASKLKLTFSNTSGEKKGISIYEIECSGNKTDEVTVEEDPTNILLGTTNDAITFTGRNKPGGTYAATNAFDGDTSTRWATSDAAGAFSVTVDLENTYNVKTMRIYDFRNSGSDKVDGVLATRSDKTSVEVYSGGKWTTVIDEVPLTVETSYTEFDLGFSEASKLRITFNNTKFSNSASIYEITCTAAKLKYPDRRELLKAIKTAEATDYSAYSETINAIVDNVIAESIETLSQVPVGQAQLDNQVKLLSDMKTLIEEGNSDVLIEETDVYDGSATVSLTSVTDDIKIENGVAGLGGKAADDVVYKLSGTPASSHSGKNYFGIQPSGVAQSYTMEFNFMLATENSGIQINTGFYDSDDETQINPVFMDINKNGFVIKTHSLIDESSSKTAAPLEIGKWYKIAVVANYNAEGNDTIYVYINGEKHEVKLTQKYYLFRHARVPVIKSSSPVEVYYDNIVHKLEDTPSYNPNRDKLNVLTPAEGSSISVSGQVIDLANTLISVADLKEAVGEDIRVYKDSAYTALLSDTDFVTNESAVVAFAKNLRNYERTYNYYTIANAAPYDEAKINVTAIDGTIYSVSDSADWGPTKTGTYSSAKEFTLRASANSDAKFLYWEDAISGKILSYSEEYTFTVGTGKTLIAVCASGDAGYVTFKNANSIVLAGGYSGSGLTVPADPYLCGYTFAGWYVRGIKQEITAGSEIDGISENTVYQAGFTADETLYSITATNTNEEGGSYKYNTYLTFTPAEKDGETFAYWKKGKNIVSYNKTYSFYVSADETVTAVFNEEVKEDVLLVMSNPTVVSSNKIAFFAERSVPDGYTLLETGILLHNSENVSLTNYTHKAVASSTTATGQFTIRKANVKNGETWYAVSYAMYTDGEEVYTKYSNEVSKSL